MMNMVKMHVILYVSDQEASKQFYQHVLAQHPTLHVPGMTEFELPGGCVLGLMPEAGIRTLLGDSIPDPASASGIPRAELYLIVDDAQGYFHRAVKMGGKVCSPIQPRDWGAIVAYLTDPDGHVLAFAEKESVSNVSG